MKKRLIVAITLMLAFSLTACNLKGKTKIPEPVEKTVYMEGIQKEYTLLFLTDTHVAVLADTDSEAERLNGEQRRGMFVSSDGTPSSELFPEWVEYANRKKVDALLLGGDIIDYPTEGNLTYLKENLDRLTVPYLLIPGNHDWTFPWEYMTEKGKEEYLPALPFQDKYGDYQVLDMGEFRVIGLNDSSGQITAESLSEFQGREGKEIPTILLVHVPFMTPELLAKANADWPSPVVIGGEENGGIDPNEDTKVLREAITEAGSSVELVLGGHVHLEDDGELDGEKNVRQIVGDDGYSGTGILLRIKPR